MAPSWRPVHGEREYRELISLPADMLCRAHYRCRRDWRGPRRQQPSSSSAFKVALVSTMCDNASSLDSFICYYLELGFATLLLYVDDPEDEAEEQAVRAWRGSGGKARCVGTSVSNVVRRCFFRYGMNGVPPVPWISSSLRASHWRT